VPSQVPGQFRYGASRQPEKLLLLAVLQEGIATFVRYREASSRRERREFAAAEDWLTSEARSGPFDFENVCAALDFEPSYLRARLLRQGSRPASFGLSRFRFRRTEAARLSVAGSNAAAGRR
jgi:hypothetical protein